MIVLQINGEHKELPQILTIAEALQHWGYNSKEIAVAVNGDFVPRSRYQDYPLNAHDKVDVVAPIQGG